MVANLLNEVGDWDRVRDRIIAENLLQMRSLSSTKRIYREIASRLKRLTPIEFDLILHGTYQEQNYLLWLAICKRYEFIAEFAVEILHEKFLRLDFDLSYDEYDAFFNAKAEWHPEVERVAPTTRQKQRQIVFQMMRESELLSPQNRIVPAILTPALVEVIRQDSPSHFTIFPAYDPEVKR